MTAEQSKPDDDRRASAPTSTPSDPLSPLATAATQLHVMFVAYLAAGFTERQALVLIAEIVAAQGRRKD